MTDEIKILVENFKDTIKVTEKLTMASTAASLVLFVMSLVNPTFAGDHTAVKLPVVSGDAPPWIVALIALAIYFGAGVFLLLYYRSAQGIMERLRARDSAILEALMTYPSILALRVEFQLLAILFVGALGILPIFIVYRSEPEKFWLAATVLGSPYLLLFINAFVVNLKQRAHGRKA